MENFSLHPFLILKKIIRCRGIFSASILIFENIDQVWRMPDVERRQLIEVLNLDTVEKKNGQEGHEAVKEAMIEEDIFDPYEKERVEACQKKRWGEEVELVEKSTVKDKEEIEGGVSEEDEVWVSPLERRLKEDTARVKRLLAGTTNETMDEEVLEAYLQSHSDNPDRVKVVLEELAGIGALADADTDVPDLFAELNEDHFQDKGKGKGKGKSTNLKRAFPEADPFPGNNEQSDWSNEREVKQRKVERDQHGTEAHGSMNNHITIATEATIAVATVAGATVTIAAATEAGSTNAVGNNLDKLPPQSPGVAEGGGIVAQEDATEDERLLVEVKDTNTTNRGPGPSGVMQQKEMHPEGNVQPLKPEVNISP